MTYIEWKSWVRSLDWSLRWFIILILIRPIVDNFYYLKEISPLLSPLYILGILTPFLALYAIITVPKPNYARPDTYIGFMTILISLSCFALIISDTFSLNSLEFLLKYPFPFIMYFFCRRLIRSKKDLHGVFQTFLYSSIVVILIFTYELIFGPINIQISRGLERFQGSYADVMNYAIYTTVGILLIYYLFLEKNDSATKRQRIILLFVAVTYALLILFKIQHTASYAVMIALSLLFILTNLRSNIGVGIVVILFVGIFIYTIGADSLSDKVTPLIETDIKVYEGEKENEQLLHGRVGRWMNFLDYFNSKSSFIQFFGLPFGMDHPYSFIAKGSHNDFLRTLMFSGYIGLLTYILILITIGVRVVGKSVPLAMLGAGMFSILLLYSISTTPLLYPILNYIMLPIFCALILPKSVMK